MSSHFSNRPQNTFFFLISVNFIDLALKSQDKLESVALEEEDFQPQCLILVLDLYNFLL